MAKKKGRNIEQVFSIRDVEQLVRLADYRNKD